MAPDETPPDVLSSLPRTRPQRRSARRATPGAAPAKPKAAPAEPKAAPATAKAAAKPKAAATKAKARPKAAPAKPRAAAKPAPAPRIPPAGFAPPAGDEGRAPSGSELVGTAIQAAGELAQIGLAVGGQALRSALGRLGRS